MKETSVFKILSNTLFDNLDDGVALTKIGKLNFSSFSGLKVFFMSLVGGCLADVVYIRNPSASDLFFCSLVKVLSRSTHIVLFDLILNLPLTYKARLVVVAKGFFLKFVDKIIVIHRYTKGYQDVYGISAEKFVYIPFKANNFDLVGSVDERDCGYILASGASYRDYETLISALEGTSIDATIVCSDESVKLHYALIREEMPDNVTRVREFLSREKYLDYIASARIVVVPIIEGTIQPAGVSVYLEAMAFGKPVIVTEGASTIGILDETLACVVPSGDRVELLKAIESLWYDPAKRVELGERGREYCLSLGSHQRLMSDVLGELVAYRVYG